MAITWTAENASQEWTNAWTHGLAFLVSLPAGLAIIWASASHSSFMLMACAVYSATLTSMYLFSALSHAIREPSMRQRVRALDQGFIYTFIAGTFTPLVIAFLSGWLCAAMLILVWSAAFAGFYSKVFSNHRIDNMASLTYLLLGWVPAMVLFQYVPTACFALMAVGGVIYSLGVWFLQNDHRSFYHHAIWHVSVIAASASHYLVIWLYAV
ncbi:MAG: hemolysin III family protein [Pirellula sp.]